MPECRTVEQLNDMSRISQTLFTLRPAALGSLAMLIALQAAALGGAAPASARTNAAPKLTIQETPINRDLKAATSVAPVVKKVAPSVVNIYSTVTIHERPNQLFSDPFFRRFFGEEPGGQTQPRTHREQSLGSGVIVSPDGYILTANHVVEGADKVKVGLASGEKEFDAKVIGTDPATDTAVLKVDGKNLPAITIADSDKLEVGDVVLAVGNPFGVGQTVTMGIVSALGRGGFGINNYENFIQTDAAVNPGNSGGPLFDANGAVVGISAQIYSSSGGYQGVSFAIPINVAVKIKDQIVNTGKVVHARLGVQVQTLDQTLANSFKLNAPNGALVDKVEPDSAASQAGIKVGDVILKVDGAPIVDAGQLSARIGSAVPGDKASLEVWRDGKVLTVMATIGTATRLAEPSAGIGPTPGRLGLAVRPLNPQEQRAAGVTGGLVVEDAQGRAAEAGIQAGDVLLSVDGTPVDNVAQLRKMVQDHGNQIALLIQRGDSRVFVPVPLG